MAIYKHPISSTTSFSDDDGDNDAATTIFFAGPHRIPLSVAPAPWSSKIRFKPNSPRTSPIAKLPAELLIHILKHLHSSRDLFNALRVSRTWCECSVELLWHKPTFPRYETLHKMAACLLLPNQTFTYSRFIRRLNFLSLSGNIKDDILFAFTSCDRLERLTLVNCGQVTDRALSRIFPSFPDLVAVDVSGVLLTTDHSISILAKTAKNLQGINLSGCSNVTDVGVIAFAQNCPYLRRVKLSGLTTLTDASISALATSCPLLLELDLNLCGLVTDTSVRDIWVHSAYMRELRLSHCSLLTDTAFPAPLHHDGWFHLDVPRPFPSQPSDNLGLAPLVLNRPMEHLRMLDLTACSLITDDAIEGLISYAPKIRNLVLSKCSLLTDRSVEQICRLGRFLHYLHLGHVVKITDSSVRTLARSCNRLRYVDFANCVLLTDMSVFELSALPRLRRIGLVRVSNLTDEAIYALGDRHTTLERIHLSYCDQISVMAIHFLLQKLHKLTHLSLTGIPAFRQPELQQFCRDPPRDLNSTQQMAFCVYSGKGVAELRQFLTVLFDHITELNATDDTEYEDEEDDDDPYNIEDTPYEGEDDVDVAPQDEIPYAAVVTQDYHHRQPNNPPPSHEFVFRRDRPNRNATIPPNGMHIISHVSSSANIEGATDRLNAQILAASATPNTSRRQAALTHSMADVLPVVESSNSLPLSDTASNHTNGAGPSRSYQDGAPLGGYSRHAGALTPDLNLAEIGHGRGMNNNSGQHDSTPSRSTLRSASYQRPPLVEADYRADSPVVASHNSTSMAIQTTMQGGSHSHALSPLPPWPYREPDDNPSPAPRVSETARTASVADERGRSMKRSLRSTIHFAEHYANSLFRRSTSRVSGSSPSRRGSGSGPHWR